MGLELSCVFRFTALVDALRTRQTRRVFAWFARHLPTYSRKTGRSVLHSPSSSMSFTRGKWKKRKIGLVQAASFRTDVPSSQDRNWLTYWIGKLLRYAQKKVSFTPKKCFISYLLINWATPAKIITRKQSTTLEGYVDISAKCLHTFCESATVFLMNSIIMETKNNWRPLRKIKVRQLFGVHLYFKRTLIEKWNHKAHWRVCGSPKNLGNGTTLFTAEQLYLPGNNFI